MTKELPDAQREGLQGKIARQRLGKPEEIARGGGLLATPAAAYVTGAPPCMSTVACTWRKSRPTGEGARFGRMQGF